MICRFIQAKAVGFVNAHLAIMKNKLVLWGTNTQDEKVLVAMELLPDNNKVVTYLFPEAIATDEFYQKMMDLWRTGQPVEFPEGHQKLESELTMTETLLPESIRVDRGDLIQRAQTEWHYMVLSSKLNQSYRSELEEMEERANKLDRFDNELWDSLKGFWDKVQNQVRERTLLREHADQLRDRTNAAFNQLKALRSRMDEEFRSKSRENVDRFFSALDEAERRVEEGLHLSKVFDELKELQQKFRSIDFTRDHRTKVWQRLDNAFKAVKEKRYGGASTPGGSEEGAPVDRTNRRHEGLISAIEKMERSIERDEADLNFQKKKIDATDGQLEAQIRQAKIMMIEQRIQSKREKLLEMHQTREQLEDRMSKIQDREDKRKERERLEEAKVAAKEKIAGEIRAQQEALSDDQEKLAKAAAAIAPPKAAEGTTDAPPAPAPEAEVADADDQPEAAPAAQEEESLLDAVTTTLGESLEDMMDTVKAVSSVVVDQLEEAIEEVKEKVLGKEEDEEQGKD